MDEKGDVRGCKRFPHYSTVGYVPSQHAGTAILKGLAVNKSVQGLCIYVFHPLSAGEKIVITSDSLDGICDKAGTVMWTKKIAKEMFKVGLNLGEGS